MYGCNVKIRVGFFFYNIDTYTDIIILYITIFSMTHAHNMVQSKNICLQVKYYTLT